MGDSEKQVFKDHQERKENQGLGFYFNFTLVKNFSVNIRYIGVLVEPTVTFVFNSTGLGSDRVNSLKLVPRRRETSWGLVSEV